MRVICACDPWGSSMHRRLVEHLRGKGAGVDVDDRGLFGKYYEAAHAVGGEVEAAAAAGGGDTRGLLVCGPGQGMCIVANKWPHVYAARCTTTHEAADCRTFNNANVLCLGSRVTPADEACQMVDVWLSTPLGEEPDLIVRSMQEIPALSFSAEAAAAIAAQRPCGKVHTGQAEAAQ